MARWTDYTEPARIRAIITAAVGLAAALGLTIPFDLPGLAEAAILLLSVVLPIVQGEATRAKVVPYGKHAALERGVRDAGLSAGPSGPGA